LAHQNPARTLADYKKACFESSDSSSVGLEEFDVARPSGRHLPSVEFFPAAIFLVRFCIAAKMNTGFRISATTGMNAAALDQANSFSR
jgi:hypothetical protein